MITHDYQLIMNLKIKTNKILYQEVSNNKILTKGTQPPEYNAGSPYNQVEGYAVMCTSQTVP